MRMSWIQSATPTEAEEMATEDGDGVPIIKRLVVIVY